MKSNNGIYRTVNSRDVNCPITERSLEDGFGSIPIFYKGKDALRVSGMVLDDKGEITPEYAKLLAEYVTTNDLTDGEVLTGEDVLKNSKDNPNIATVGKLRPNGSLPTMI